MARYAFCILALIALLACGAASDAGQLVDTDSPPATSSSTPADTPTVELATSSPTDIPRPTEVPPSPTITAVPVATMAPTAMPASACLPQCTITLPAHGTTVQGVVRVQGTANVEQFQYYKIEYSLDGGQSWAVAGELHYEPVVDGVLGEWDTSSLPEGPCRLRLVAVNQGGNFPEPCVLQLNVGSADTRSAVFPTEAVAKVTIIAVNKRAEYVDIQNVGGIAQDLAGWVLLSEKGAQRCPLAGILQAGQTLRIWAMSADANQGGYNCGFDTNIWNNSERDAAVLLDAQGIEIDRK